MTSSGHDQNEENNQEPAIDGRFRLKVSRDKLAVYMDGLQAPKGGGSPVEAKIVHRKLKKLEVKYGINNKKIDEIIATLNEGRLPTPDEDSVQEEEGKSHLCIVKGNAPTYSQDASLQWHINEETAHNYIVLPGELIAIFNPKGQGTPGKSIYGKPITVQPSRDNTVKPGDGIEQTHAGEHIEYHAKWFGKIQIKDNAMTVDCPLKVSDDNMSATLDLLPPSSADQTLELNHIIETLQQHEIIFGIKEDVLTESLKTLNESRQPVNELVVAEGTPVTHGIDAKISWNIDPAKITAKDYVIRPGDLIATHKPVTTDEPGQDIHDNIISATPGKDTAIQLGDNITETENSHEYHAATLGILKYKADDETIQISIDPGLDVTDNAMEARLNLFRESTKGTPVELSDVTKSLKACGIKFGIDEAAIKEALEPTDKNEAAQLKKVLVAQGKPPQDGVDTHIEYTQKENIAGQELNKGRIDFREHNYPWSFKEGDIIGHLNEAKPEEDGINVWGETIKAMPHNETALELEGAHKDVRNKIIADIDGTLLINGLHLNLTDLLVIDGDVAQKTGNIHSVTGVHVKGYVEPGFKLESDKSIIIDKNVEDAAIRSGGSITIKGGIRGLKSEVYAPGEVSVDFIENADVFVNGDINTTGSIINSKVSSNSAISVGSKKSKKSAIIGGRVTAHTKVEALVLGSSAYPKTVVSVGFTQEAKQQQRDLTGNIETKEGELTRLDQVETHYKLKPKAGADEVMRKISATRESLTKEIESLKEQLDEAMEQVKQSENVRVVVHKQIFPGVTIKINDYDYKVTREMSGGTFALENNEIIFRPG